VTGGWKALHNEDIRHSYSSRDVTVRSGTATETNTKWWSS